MYYSLHEHCKLIMGKAKGAIYDLHSGKVYSINTVGVNLLNIYRNNPFRSLHTTLSPAHSHFFDTLTKKGLGSFYLTEPAPRHFNDMPIAEATLNFVWIELTARCNNKCLHCYTDSTPSEADTILPLERQLSLLEEIRQTGCSAIQFIGGEPLLYPHWRNLIQKAAEEKFTMIELFTNATLLTDEIIDFLSVYQVNIATTLYAANASIHDAVTQNPGSFSRTLINIKKIIDKHIPLRIASILMKTNEHEADNIMQLCHDLGVEALPPDIIRPTGRGQDSNLLPDSTPRPLIQPPFYVTETDFYLSQTNHPCLAGKIAITASGDVLPCIFARRKLLGNVGTSSLADILKTPLLHECWHTTKDKIEKCRDCEFRYACPDCRPLAQNSDTKESWLAPPIDCRYNPYTGLWDK